MGLHSTVFGPSNSGLSFLMYLYWSMKPPDCLQSTFHLQTQILPFAAVIVFLFFKPYILLLNSEKNKEISKENLPWLTGKTSKLTYVSSVRPALLASHGWSILLPLLNCRASYQNRKHNKISLFLTHQKCLKDI